jgi:hypothetical protein
MTSPQLIWVDLFSEGGPFILAEEPIFRSWPGDDGWDTLLEDCEAPGILSRSTAGMFCIFDPEDPGPIAVGVGPEEVLLIRWSEGGAAPAQMSQLTHQQREALETRIRSALTQPGDAEETYLGVISVSTGLLVIAWAAIAGKQLEENTHALELLATSNPRETRRFNDSGPALTAAKVDPGIYEVTGAFDYRSHKNDQAVWVYLRRKERSTTSA